MERRLAAIMATDVVGYSRLIREDEVGTLAALKAHRKQLIEPKVAERKGRIVKLMGDGILIEFPSAVEAVRCAVEFQHMIGDRNATVSEEKRIVYRIGINIGDIVVEDDDIYGDGVNLAARLEGLAEPGGICISGNAYEQVENKLPLSFEFIGKQTIRAPPRAMHHLPSTGPESFTLDPTLSHTSKTELNRGIGGRGVVQAVLAAPSVKCRMKWKMIKETPLDYIIPCRHPLSTEF